MTDVTVLDVLLYGEPIGTLVNLPGDRTLFAFKEQYIENPARPVLGLGFKNDMGGLITNFRPTQRRLLPFFSGLLPEGHLRTYLAERAGVNPEREFLLLRALGRDLPGAITVTPVTSDARSVASGDDQLDFDQDRVEGALRFSLAGMQLKFSAANDASGRLTIPAQGMGGHWVVKLPSPEFQNVPENEYSMMTLARMVGINVPGIQLVDVGEIGNLPEGIGTFGGQALAVERFDRLSDGTAIHVEDFAQVFRVYPEKKYRGASYRAIAAVLAAEGNERDIEEFVRRIVFSMLIGNADMHLKNWSVIYPKPRHVALSPAYDFVSTVPYIRGQEAALRISRSRRFDEFTEDELLHMADKARLPVKPILDTARETVDLFFQNWTEYKENFPLSKEVVAAIDAHLKTVPIARPSFLP